MRVRSRIAIGVATCLLFVASACGFPVPRGTVHLARLHCRTDAEMRAGSARTAILFVRNHVYVGEDGLGSTFGVHFVELIPRLIGSVNDYLRSKDAGIVLVEVGTDVTVNRAMYVVDTTGPGGIPAAASLAEVDRVAAESPEEVHIHWSPKSTSRVTGYGGRPHGVADTPPTNWIGYVEDPLSGPPRSDAQRMPLLAHELGHYLGLEHNGIDGNLMDGPELPNGNELTASQIRVMQHALNADRTHLLVVSCTRGPGIAELLRRYPGRELLRLAAGV